MGGTANNLSCYPSIIFRMSPTSPTDTIPPPSYQMSLEEFDRKTSQAIQNAPVLDEDGWEVYDSEVFESAAGNHEHSPPSSSSARILGTDTSRHVREGRRLFGKASRKASGKALPPTPLKVRISFLSFSRSVSLTLIFPIFRSEMSEIPSLKTSTGLHHHLHHSHLLPPLWMAPRLTK